MSVNHQEYYLWSQASAVQSHLCGHERGCIIKQCDSSISLAREYAAKARLRLCCLSSSFKQQSEDADGLLCLCAAVMTNGL